MSGYFATPTEREQYIAGMRAFLDYVEAHPEVPVPPSEDIQLSTWGDTFADRVQTVDEFAALVAARPQWLGEGETHWKATIEFGPIRFFCVAIKRDEDIALDAEQSRSTAPAAVSR